MVRNPPARARTIDSPTYAEPPASGVARAESAPPATDGDAAIVERELEKLQGQLTQLKAQVRQAQQLAGLGTAAAMIAHEVNNLLTPVKSYAQAALSNDDIELQRKALTVTVKNVELLVAMSERVLNISAAKPPVREPVSLRRAADDAVASLCRDLSKDGISLVLRMDESLTVWADALQLQQVLFNLLLNASNAMRSSHGGRITVAGAIEAGKGVIEVKDNGPGIPAEMLPRIFDPLQTSKPMDPKGQQRCAGLGLALCRDLVMENGGTITVASEPGVGTTFTITLPANEPAAQ